MISWIPRKRPRRPYRRSRLRSRAARSSRDRLAALLFYPTYGIIKDDYFQKRRTARPEGASPIGAAAAPARRGATAPAPATGGRRKAPFPEHSGRCLRERRHRQGHRYNFQLRILPRPHPDPPESIPLRLLAPGQKNKRKISRRLIHAPVKSISSLDSP